MDPLVSGQKHHNKIKQKPTTIKPENFSKQPTFGINHSGNINHSENVHGSNSMGGLGHMNASREKNDKYYNLAENSNYRSMNYNSAVDLGNQEAKNSAKKSSNCSTCSPFKVIFMLAIAVVIFIFGIVGGFYIDREIILKSKVNTSQSRVNSAAEAFIGSDLIAKVSYLSMAASKEQPAYLTSYTVKNYEEIFSRFLDNALTDADKFSISVNSLMDEYQLATDSPNENLPYYIPANRVTERYISIFGTEPGEVTSSSYCPGYIYDAAKGVFYVSKECGNVAVNPDVAYKELVKYDDNNGKAYVYLRVGSIITSNTDAPGVYTDIASSETKSRFKTPEDFESDEAMQNFQINTNNYENFTEYIVTFSKNAKCDFSLYSVSKTGE